MSLSWKQRCSLLLSARATSREQEQEVEMDQWEVVQNLVQQYWSSKNKGQKTGPFPSNILSLEGFKTYCRWDHWRESDTDFLWFVALCSICSIILPIQRLFTQTETEIVQKPEPFMDVIEFFKPRRVVLRCCLCVHKIKFKKESSFPYADSKKQKTNNLNN